MSSVAHGERCRGLMIPKPFDCSFATPRKGVQAVGDRGGCKASAKNLSHFRRKDPALARKHQTLYERTLKSSNDVPVSKSVTLFPERLKCGDPISGPETSVKTLFYDFAWNLRGNREKGRTKDSGRPRPGGGLLAALCASFMKHNAGHIL